MTVLDEIVLDEQQGIVLKLFEAPIHESTQIGRRMWVYDGVPFFDRELAEFWESREISSLEKGVMLPTYYEQEERRAFIKKPIVLVQDAKQNRTAGCIWVDGVLYEKNLTGQLVNPRARFHIGFGKKYRRFAYPAMAYFIGVAHRKYSSIIAGWNDREPEDDPTKFFRNNDFLVTYRNGKGYAIMYMNAAESAKSPTLSKTI